jgi:hypothetical protein
MQLKKEVKNEEWSVVKCIEVKIFGEMCILYVGDSISKLQIQVAT